MRKPEPKIAADHHKPVADDDLGDTAVFFDFENIVLGVRSQFRPARVFEHLSSRGDVLIRKAYADWGRYSRYQSELLELGVDMVFLPSYGIADKNRTDTAIAVDVMEILFLRPNIETFVIVSGDSDFGVLARKLRGYGKHVIGISAKSSASKVLAAVCHEFIFYEMLAGERLQGYSLDQGEKLIRRALPSIVENRGTFQPSLLKDRMRKIDSTFHERNFGFSSFLKFIESYPKLIHIERYPGGRTELSAADGADLRPAKESDKRATSAPRSDKRDTDKRDSDKRDSDKRDSGKSDSGKPDGKGREEPEPGKRTSDARGQAVEAFRKLIQRILATEKEPITLNRLNKRLHESVPSFDHKKLGYSRFIDFVRGQEDVLKLIRKGRSYRVVAA